MIGHPTSNVTVETLAMPCRIVTKRQLTPSLWLWYNQLEEEPSWVPALLSADLSREGRQVCHQTWRNQPGRLP
jgi:hypothetical protein